MLAMLTSGHCGCSLIKVTCNGTYQSLQWLPSCQIQWSILSPHSTQLLTFDTVDPALLLRYFFQLTSITWIFLNFCGSHSSDISSIPLLISSIPLLISSIPQLERLKHSRAHSSDLCLLSVYPTPQEKQIQNHGTKHHLSMKDSQFLASISPVNPRLEWPFAFWTTPLGCQHASQT